LREATIAIAPLLAGSGTRLKVLEALAHGCPVISTTYGCSGLAVTPGEDLVVADGPLDFANGVISLLADSARRERMARAGRLVAEAYNWALIGRRYEEALLDLVERRRFDGHERLGSPHRPTAGPRLGGSPTPEEPSRVSLIATVRNEARSISGFVQSIKSQTRPPDEMILVDGGSSDGTLETLRELAKELPWLRVESKPSANISAGRNAAIGLASGEIIAVTDAGTHLEPDWLELLVQPLIVDPQTSVSAGFFSPGGATFFARTLAAVITPHSAEVDATRFLPSSRSVAFRREAWRLVGGYPEWLDHCEDLVFDLALKHAGLRFTFTPDARVRWDARRTLAGFFAQYYHYARGDGMAGLWPGRHALRYTAYGSGLMLALLGRRLPLAWLALLIGIIAYMRKFLSRLWRHHPHDQPLLMAAAALVPLIVVVGDVAKMTGYPTGLIRRFANGRAITPHILHSGS
jgi:glycosyltransferase involved in cell wall biosynthesis